MKRRWLSMDGVLAATVGLLILAVPSSMVAEPSAQAVSAFNAYVASAESRLARQHESPSGFLAPVASPAKGDSGLQHGEVVIQELTAADGSDIPGAMLHDWRGTAFVAGATVEDFETLMRNFEAYPQVFSPQVLQASVLAHQGEDYKVRIRVKQQHIITVVMDTTYDVTFRQMDKSRGYSTSRSTQISEIGSAGSPGERTLQPGEEHGFLWRMNTYWTYEERDGGLYMQIESISLTRSIPTGLGWIVRPFVESVPRESLDFTLRAVCNRLRK